MNVMRSRIGAMLVGMAAVVGAGSVSLLAQEPATKGSSQSRRVPPGFSKVGVTPEQKEKIYAIRGKYQAEIVLAQKKVDELKAREIVDCEAVLTDAQRKQLEAVRSESAKAKSKGE